MKKNWIASDSVFAIIIYKNKLLLFHRDNIETIPYPDHWHLPGGRIDGNESPSETIKRELTEEITHVPERLKYLGRFKKDDGKFSYTFLSIVDENESKLFILGPDEGQQIKFFTIKEMSKLNLTNTVKLRLDRYRYLIPY